MADIKVYGTLRTMATDGIVATADQLKDTNVGKFQEEINHELAGGMKGKQDTIEDLEQIRSLANSAVQPSVLQAAIADFITKSVDDLVNYYKKSETYTKAEVNGLIGAIKQFTYRVASSLPTASESTMYIIYLIPSSNASTQNVKDEFITIQNGSSYSWEQIGSTKIDLSDYSTTEEMNAAILSGLNNLSFLTGEKVVNLGVDEEPTAGSENLVKSGGVHDKIIGIIDSGTTYDSNSYGYSSRVGVFYPLNGKNNKIHLELTNIVYGDLQLSVVLTNSISPWSAAIVRSIKNYSKTSSSAHTLDIELTDAELVSAKYLAVYSAANSDAPSFHASAYYIGENIKTLATDVTDIKQQVNGTITKDVVWSNGYISTNGEINSSSLSYYSQPILLHAGEGVKIGTQNPNICVIGSTNADSLSVGDTVSVIQTIPSSSSGFVTYEYIATEDIKVVLCVLKSNYTLKFFDADNLDFRVQKIENHYPVVQDGMNDLTIMDEGQNILALFKGGHIKTRNFDSSATDSVHSYISAEAYNQIPIEKCGYDKVCRLPTCTVDRGKVTRKYEQFNYITRIALWGDPHIGYGYSFTNVPKGSYDGYGWKDWEDYVELSFKRASNKVPDFGIPLGDNLSSVNNFLYNNGGSGIIERSDWYNRIRQFNYPLFSIFGNHDDAIPDFIHKGVIEIMNIRIIVFHMDIVYKSPISTYNISDYEFAWLENAVKDSYNKGFVTVLASHYPIICDSGEGSLPREYLGRLLVGTHGQDLIDLCQTYDVRLHIHGHVHPTGLPYKIMTNKEVPFDMTTVEIGLGARAYVILEIRDDGFHFTEYPLTRQTKSTEEGGVTYTNYEVLDDMAGRTLFVPFYNQASGTVRSDDWTPYPGTE